MKTSELIGAELDYWVAMIEGILQPEEWVNKALFLEKGIWSKEGQYFPSTNWQQGGPLIEKYNIELQTSGDGLWCASLWPPENNDLIGGETPLIAAMRCIVASKFGDEVDD